jgi:hypothetical protein
MCLITVTSKASLIKPEPQAEALRGNRDGFGFLGFVDGALRAERFPGVGHTRSGATQDAYSRTFLSRLAWWKEASPEYLAVHLRQRTHGPRDAATAHPFPVTGSDFTGQVMHNGVFPLGQILRLSSTLGIAPPDGAAHSDTMQVLAILNAAKLSREAYLEHLVRLASDNPFNRLLFWADGDRAPLVINMPAGISLHGGSLWLSNDWYVPASSAA